MLCRYASKGILLYRCTQYMCNVYYTVYYNFNVVYRVWYIVNGGLSKIYNILYKYQGDYRFFFNNDTHKKKRLFDTE